MNKTYSNNDIFISNNGTYDGLYGDAYSRVGNPEKVFNRIYKKCKAGVHTLTGSTAHRLIKASGAAFSLIGILGTAGAMERGTLSLWSGLLISFLLVGVEYLCLRPTVRRNRK